jgi:hypothetical protein
MRTAISVPSGIASRPIDGAPTAVPTFALFFAGVRNSSVRLHEKQIVKAEIPRSRHRGPNRACARPAAAHRCGPQLEDMTRKPSFHRGPGSRRTLVAGTSAAFPSLTLLPTPLTFSRARVSQRLLSGVAERPAVRARGARTGRASRLLAARVPVFCFRGLRADVDPPRKQTGIPRSSPASADQRTNRKSHQPTDRRHEHG